MAVVTVRLDDRKIESLFDRPTELRAYMNRKVAETVVVARAEAPTRTPRTTAQHGSIYLGGGKWKVSATVAARALRAPRGLHHT